jgi:Ca2+-binding RTX toxin-like protein
MAMMYTWSTSLKIKLFELNGVNAGSADLIKSSASYTLPLYVENLTLLNGATWATGNNLGNLITGNTGDNTIDGGTGADTMIGGGE